MGYIPLDSIVRSAIANKGHTTMHLYVPFLHWSFQALKKFQAEGYYTNIKSVKENLDENNCIPIPPDMLMWNKIGLVTNGVVYTFVNDDALSLIPGDHNKQDEQGVPRGLFSYDSDALDVLYTTNIYVATSNGVVRVGAGNNNSFKFNWEANKIQVKGSLGGREVYLEYVAKAHDPSTETMVNEIAEDYIEQFIYWREARFRFGSSHREAKSAEGDWLNAQDELAENSSDLTGQGLLRALNEGTRKTIDQ